MAADARELQHLARMVMEQQAQLVCLDNLNSMTMRAHSLFLKNTRHLRQQHKALVARLYGCGLLSDADFLSQMRGQEPTSGLAALLGLPAVAHGLLMGADVAAAGRLSSASREFAELAAAAVYTICSESSLRLASCFVARPCLREEEPPSRGAPAVQGGDHWKTAHGVRTDTSGQAPGGQGRCRAPGVAWPGPACERPASGRPRRSLQVRLRGTQQAADVREEALQCPGVVGCVESLLACSGAKQLRRLRAACRALRASLPEAPPHAARRAAKEEEGREVLGSGRVLEPGRLVAIRGLRSRPELNGAKGHLVHHDTAVDRWHVCLDSGECTRIRAENLEPEEAPPPSTDVGGMVDVPGRCQILLRCGPEVGAAWSLVLALSLAGFLGLRRAGPAERASTALAHALRRCMKVCVCFGMDRGGQMRRSIECFDPVSERSWEVPLDFQPLGGINGTGGTAMLGRHLYLFGCCAKRGPLDYGASVDLLSGEWRLLPPMARVRRSAAVAVLAGWIYACGGLNSTFLNCVERLSAQGHRWEPVPSMLQARCFGIASALRGHLYVCGGSLGRKAVACVERFNPSASWPEWELLVPMHCKRFATAAAVLGGRLYLCGGYDCVEALRCAECFDPDMRDWQRLPPMSQPRCGATALSVGGCLYVCGGDGGDPAFFAERFDPEAGCWEAVAPMLEPRAHAAVASVGGLLYVCGGRVSGGSQAGPRGSVERLDPATGVWEALPGLQQPRWGAWAAEGAF